MHQFTRISILCLLLSFSSIVSSNPKEQHLDFDNGYIEIADSAALDLDGGQFTLSAWINPLSWGQNNQGRILDHGGGSSGNEGWSLHLENKSSRGYPQALHMQINNDPGFNGNQIRT